MAVIPELRSRGVRLSDDDVGRLLAKIRELVNRRCLRFAQSPRCSSSTTRLAEIVHGFQAVRDGGALALCNLVPQMRQLLVVAKLDPLIRSTTRNGQP
jgi:hypothetical protein